MVDTNFFEHFLLMPRCNTIKKAKKHTPNPTENEEKHNKFNFRSHFWFLCFSAFFTFANDDSYVV